MCVCGLKRAFPEYDGRRAGGRCLEAAATNGRPMCRCQTQLIDEWGENSPKGPTCCCAGAAIVSWSRRSDRPSVRALKPVRKHTRSPRQPCSRSGARSPRRASLSALRWAFFMLFLTFSLPSIAPFTPRRCRALRLPARWRRDNAGVKTNSEDFPLWSGVWVFFWCRWIHTQQTSAVTADRAGALGFCNWIIVAVTEERLLHKRPKGLKITGPSCWWWCGGTGEIFT